MPDELRMFTVQRLFLHEKTLNFTLIHDKQLNQMHDKQLNQIHDKQLNKKLE